MKLTEKLNVLMEKNGLTRGGLAKATGIPYSTIVGIYEKGYENIRLPTLRRLAAYFGLSLDLLADDSQGLESAPSERTADPLAEKIQNLSPKGRRLLSGMVEGLLDYERPEAEPEVLYIREYVTPAAAGYASPAEGEDYVLVPRGVEVPEQADFAVRIAGDSMEPYIQDGSRVYVRRGAELADGDVGIFFVDGSMKCKQYCEDPYGNVYLLSLNRARADSDVTILASGGLRVCCFGKVLLKKRPPMAKPL